MDYKTITLHFGKATDGIMNRNWVVGNGKEHEYSRRWKIFIHRVMWYRFCFLCLRMREQIYFSRESATTITQKLLLMEMATAEGFTEKLTEKNCGMIAIQSDLQT